MKKIVLLLMVIMGSLVSLPVSAGVQDFHFSDFTADYYLSKDEEGISHLKVVEVLVAQFPTTKQNKGICRYIPFTNQQGGNITLPYLNKSNIKVLRNGETEPIYSIEKEDNFYNVCTGTDEYVLGGQEYVFEYDFERVVTDFGNYQELYWDTNGNGWRQSFDSVTARVHFDKPEMWSGKSWCYVGKYNQKNPEKCTTTKIEDGVEFTAKNLKAYENLTFDAELAAGYFVVPEPMKDYTLVWLLVWLGVICAVVVLFAVVKFIKSREKANYYKNLFIKPEYQPHADYSLPEMAQLYTGKKKDTKVAMLLELAVNKKIELKKGEKKHWSILVKNLDGVTKEYLDLLAILNGGLRPQAGSEIEVKRRTATTTLVTLRNTMQKKIERDLKKDDLVTKEWKYGTSTGGFGSVIWSSLIMVPVILFLATMAFALMEDIFGISEIGTWMVFSEQFFIVSVAMIAVTTFVVTWLLQEAGRYKNYTTEGLKAARYMDGLKMYIEMAEAERMKLLQSVEGADTSAEGIVKLYEKLLPYAAVFGLEESWMDEMKEYCRVEEVPEPDYLMTGIMVHDITQSFRDVANIASASTIMSSSGGGSSSGFSGGGGGGFSGGGGGGGGGGGR